MSASTSTDTGLFTPPVSTTYIGIMPRPGQPGAMHLFDDSNITEYIEDWNAQCEDYRYDNPQRCARFPNYCTSDIKDIVKLLPGYISHDWTQLQADVKNLYWQLDRLKNTMAALNELIRSAKSLDLNVYILKYTSMQGRHANFHMRTEHQTYQTQLNEMGNQ